MNDVLDTDFDGYPLRIRYRDIPDLIAILQGSYNEWKASRRPYQVKRFAGAPFEYRVHKGGAGCVAGFLDEHDAQAFADLMNDTYEKGL